MGEKIWWRWLVHPHTPWASLWTAKYASNYPLEERVRPTETGKGSPIWNSAAQHRHLIQEHSFWELKNGATARFWTDSWQQFPKLKDILQDLPIPEQEVDELATVNPFWTTITAQDSRHWQSAIQILSNSPPNIQHILETELQKRQIKKSEGRDTLRWGYGEKGIFSTKEAYNIIIQKQISKDLLWEKIWHHSNWPKVSTFLWLLGHNRILTWDNLRKRGFIGPSICHMCRKEEETALHLLQTCQRLES